MGGLRIFLLGGFGVLVNNREIPDDAWRLRKARNLIKLLALEPDHRLHREQILEHLWPERSLDAAANNLRVTLHTARRLLQMSHLNSPLVLSQGEFLALDRSQSVWVDVHAFEEAARQCGNHPQAYHAALDLYAGDLLPDDLYDEWVCERREALRQTHINLLFRLSKLYGERGDTGDAIEMLHRLLSSEIAHEETHVELMRLYAESGNRLRALAQYQHLRDALQQELDVEPDQMSQRLYEAILANRFPDEFALQPRWPASGSPVRIQQGPASTRAPRRTNLPAETSSFIGPQKEIASLKRALNEHRLVTLTGAGGTGKSRLALRVAANVSHRYPDGVWLVEIAGLSDSILVPQVVAATLAIDEQAGRPFTDAIVETLRDRRLLVILDNCEHLIDACASLAEALLRGCPDARILTTSREALRIAGEAMRSVPPLPVPDDGCDREGELADAVQLFVDRAPLAQPAFRVTPENIRAAGAIGTRLDGLPLAIELAAARTRLLSAAQIAERLDDALPLLTGGGRTAPERQQTLLASMDWSYDLLDQDERALLRRLSIFAGGCTLEAAEMVCATDGIAPDAVLDLLFQLVDKSLVVVEDVGGEPRCRLLEPIRQYAAQRLKQAAEADVIRERHLNWCVGLAEESERALRGSTQHEWLSRMECEHDNVRAAMSWVGSSGDAEEGLRLAAPLWRFWFTRGYLSEGRRWLETFLEHRNGSEGRIEHGRALFALGRLAYAQRDLPAAGRFFSETLAIAREHDDRDYVAGALTQLGFVAFQQDDYPTARRQFEAAVLMRRALGQDWYLAVAHVGLGRVAMAQGRYGEAHALCREALEFFQKSSDAIQAGDCLTVLAQLAHAQGDLVSARELYQESLNLVRSVGHQRLISNALSALGRVVRDQGQTEQARELYGQSLEIYRELGIRQGVDDCLKALAELG